MRGLMGESPVLKFHSFNPTIMVPMEVMHTFDLGVVLYLMQAWVGKSRKLKHATRKQDDRIIEKWSLSQTQKEELQRRIEEVRVPHGFTRKLHLDGFQKWKADGKLLGIY